MKKTLVKSIKISFQEKTSKGFVDRSFDTPKDTVGTNVAGRLASGMVLEPNEEESWCKTARHSAVALLSGVLVFGIFEVSRFATNAKKE